MVIIIILASVGYILYNNESDDNDNYNDTYEINIGTDPLNKWWKPMPNLRVLAFSDFIIQTNVEFVLRFSIKNDGIERAINITVIVKCDALNLVLYNNSESPFNLSIDESIEVTHPCPPIDTDGDFEIILIIDPNNEINEGLLL